MSESKKANVGRKPKFTLAEKKDIINRHLIANDQDPSVLTQHGIYENLARYARSINEKYGNIHGYDFYDAEIKSYISMLVDDFSDDDKAKQIGCAYIPLDLTAINQLARSHRYTEMIAVLREREDYLSNLYSKVAQAAAQNEFISSKFTMKAKELQALEAKLTALEAEVGRLTTEIKSKGSEINSLTKENRTLRRIIREKDDEISIITHNNTMHSLGINDNLKSLVRREEARIAEEQPEQEVSGGCKIIRLIPDLEEG